MKPVVLVTRKLPKAVEDRLRRDYDARLNPADALYSTEELIERAKGILMRRLDLSEEEAFRRLQKRSQDTNRRLSEVAQAIVVADQML